MTIKEVCEKYNLSQDTLRYMASPDINTEDFMAAALSTLSRRMRLSS